MFRRYEIVLNTPEMAIEVTGDVIEIKTPEGYMWGTPQEVMDSMQRLTFEDMEKRLAAKNEKSVDWIKNWYLRAVREG